MVPELCPGNLLVLEEMVDLGELVQALGHGDAFCVCAFSCVWQELELVVNLLVQALVLEVMKLVPVAVKLVREVEMLVQAVVKLVQVGEKPVLVEVIQVVVRRMELKRAGFVEVELPDCLLVQLLEPVMKLE